jgi:hypothetical protein
MYYNITVFIIILDRNAKAIGMCKEEAECDFRNDLKGCALRHIGEARKLISKGKFEEADLKPSYAARHLSETQPCPAILS